MTEKGTVFFFTGLAGAGKTTIGELFFQRMQERVENIILMDGDRRRVSSGTTKTADYSLEARLRGAYFMFQQCKDISDAGTSIVCCSISMFHEIRAWNRTNIANYREIYLKVKMETLYQRDQRGLYSSGAKNVVGVDLPWDEPSQSNLVVENDGQETPLEVVERIEKALGIV